LKRLTVEVALRTIGGAERRDGEGSWAQKALR
jgi:hypothetical protein